MTRQARSFVRVRMRGAVVEWLVPTQIVHYSVIFAASKLKVQAVVLVQPKHAPRSAFFVIKRLLLPLHGTLVGSQCAGSVFGSSVPSARRANN